jgi:hypothetical protein
LKKTQENKQGRKTNKPMPTDPALEALFDQIEASFHDTLKPFRVTGLKGFHRKIIRQRYENSHEYAIKSYRNGEEVIFKIYPVGRLRRIAEQKMQEVMMNGRSSSLPPMGAYERFIVHDYLKERDGITTESQGIEGKDRHIVVKPLFGREPRKQKRRLTR